jgi:gliding motility-associated-like protein
MVDSTQRKIFHSFLRCEGVALIVCLLTALGNAQAYNMGNGTINACAGSFYDSNGPATNYLNNENYTYTVCPSGAGQCARVTFTAFNVEANYDFLSIYNGPSTASPLIGTYTGTTSPGVVTSTNGCLTFVFTSDATVRGAGWAATISCVACNAGGGPCATNCAGAPPANDACSGAQNLGTLPVPQACPNGTAAWATYNTTNLCATAEVPYTSVIGCQPAGNMANPAADVWYQFTITAPTLNVQISGLQTPQCAIYQGTSCSNMIPMGCAIGAAGNLTTTFGGLASGTYYLQVSGGSITDRCTFTLQFQNNYDCTGCVIQSSLTVNPPPFNGTYQPGQTVNFCYTISDYNQTSINWLHAVCPSFGPGWNPASLVTVNPSNCSGAGAWNYYNALITSTATGLVTGPGWFYDSPLGDANGGYPDGNPGDNFGDNNPANTCDWTFCWNITTVPPNQCVNGTSCNIALDTYGDGESGSWTSFACNLDPVTHFLATLACCTPPTVNVTNINCATGTASATATGTSNAPWTYVWKNAAGTTLQQANSINGPNTINNLPAGTYTVIIVDNANCAAQQTFTITAPNSMTVTPAQTNILCNGGATGSASVNISGGSGPYTYAWAPAGGTGATANNLTAGTYTVTIHDNAGCVTTQQFTITQPTLLTATASGSNVNCSGGNNGSASVNAGGGTAPFTYAWSPSGGTGSSASNLTAGTYTVTVTDANGCTKTASYTVTQPPALTAAMGAPTNVNCNGGNNGSATVTAGGGITPYTYAWTPTGGTTATGTALAAGSYTVTVTDANGCTINSNVNITQPNAVTANINASTNALCNGGNTGSASVTAGGGTPVYAYAWTPSGGTGSAANNLAAGNYTVTVTDSRGCTQSATVNISQPPVLTAAANPTNVLCNGAATGSATVIPGGGTAGYTYSWSPGGGTGSTASSLGAGAYTVTVTDANGCTVTANANITQPSAITSTSSSTPTNCGSSTGSATVNPSGGTGAYSYAWSPSGGSGSTASNLAAGAYVVTITDANGCTATANVAVSNTAGPTATIPTSTNVSCNGGANGSANANAAGGTGPYTYSWTPGGGNGASATGLSAGTYSITILDANGCSASTNVTITEPPAVTAVISTSTDVICNGGTTGNATVVAAGGTAGYTYSWTPGGATGTTASNLAAGNYTVTVTDANACTQTASVTIIEPAPVTAAVPPVTNVLCNGGSTGSASVNAGGGTAPYTYAWTPSGGNGSTASGLAAGSYTVTVTDANGCTSTANATITQPAALTAVISSSAGISCNGANNGTATVTAGGGTAAYTYAWTPSGGTGATESGLAAGNYSVTVTDANGCVGNAAVTISEPTVLQTSTSGTNVDCNGNANGSASVSTTGGTAGYTFSWTPSGGSGATANNLAGGTYYITVTDANGCTAADSFVVVEPALLASSISSSTDALCSGSADGTASVLSNGGTPALTYSWTPAGGTGATASNLPAGSYSVTTTDANGCTTVATATINEPVPVALSTSSTDANCGSSNGTATVVASGGTSGYTYSWSSGGSGSTENNLPSGNVTVTVTDANGCTSSAVVAVGQSPGVTATMSASTNVNCNGGADGTATIGVAGGTAPFTYAWSPGGGSAVTATGLTAGSYSVIVTDINGCTSTDNITITEPPVLTSSAAPLDVLCNGAATGSSTVTPAGGTLPYSYLWTSGGTAITENNLAAGSYSVTVTDANGCTSVSNITITEPALLTSSTTPVDALCNGGSTGSASVTAGGGTTPYTYLWTSGGTGAAENNLAAGNYSVTVTDGNGCTSVASVTIAEPASLTSSATPVDALCSGSNTGSASVTAGGGTTPYTYSWTSGGTASTENNLAAGNYSVTVTDGNGCTSLATVTIAEPALLTASTTPVNALCNGGNTGSATVIAGGGTAPYTYAWTSGGTGSAENNLSAGNYSVTVTDANGCTSLASVTIAEPAQLTTSTTPANALCNGSTGSATVTAGGGTTPYTYSWTSGGTGTTENNLAAGNYSVTVTDGNGCTSVATVTIAEPALLTSSTTPTDASCNGSTGSATVTAAGGTIPYTYLWTSGGTGAAENNLAAGNYSVTVTDGNGCTSQASVTIAEPSLLTSSTAAVDILCNGGTTGSATVTAGGGTTPYTYSWTSGGTGPTENNLGAGNYSVTVTDGNGCTSLATITITEPALLTASATATNINCNGGTNGTTSVIVAGGTAGYAYTWSPAGGSSSTANNLPAGNYTVSITDLNGCATTASVTVTEPAAITASTSNTNVSCNGGTDGSAAVTAGGGVGPYTYSWFPAGGAGSNAANLGAGNYTVTITDANGCVSTASATVTEPSLLTSSVTTASSTCGNSNGTASAVAAGGTSGYTYSWSPSGGTAASANNLAAGAYTVTITDANGCTSSANANVANTAGQTAVASVQQDVLCNGGSTGIGAVNVAGGTAPITYAWSPAGGTGATAANLAAGNYTVTTTDANGCISADNITISQPPVLAASASSTPALCNGAADGNANTTVNGGTTPYTFSWSGGGGTGATATNLAAGNYTVTITDGNGCITTATTTVTQPATLTANASASAALCNGGTTGSATVAVNGGTSGYTYTWFPSGGTGISENNLGAGAYTVTVTDANGCTQSATANVTEPGAMTTSTNSSPALCGSTNGTASVTVNGGAGGYTYSWSPAGGTNATASNIAAGAYTVTITDANGCQATDVANVANTGGPAVAASIQQDVSCNGGSDGSGTVSAAGGTGPYTYSWSPAGGTGATSANVPAGNYTVTVTDANGCISSDNITISEPAAMAAQATPADALCNGGNSGSAATVVAGGTAPYTYSWTGGGGTAAAASNLAAGNYTVTVTDANGCTTTAAATVSQPNAIVLNATATPALCNGGSSGTATVGVNGGTSGYTYSWFPAGGTAANATNLSAGSYTVTVTDANGCTQTASANVTDPAAMTANTNTTAASCGGSNGTATVIAGNGTAPYTYSWSSGGNAVTENGLAAGSYTVTITDANGCTATAAANVTNSGGATVTASVQQNVLCNNGTNGSAAVNVAGGVGPFTYLWSPSGGNGATASNLPAGNYTITVTGSNGCISTDNVTITEPPALAAQASATNASCNGFNDGSASVVVAGGTTPYSYAWTGGGGTSAAASGLAAGNYTVTITDGNGCTTTAGATITQPSAITLSTTVTAALCNGASTGTSTATAGGGAGGFTYSWSPSGGNAATASNLAAGNYTVTVTDANGCSSNAPAVITQPAAMSLSTNTVSATCGSSNGSATATVGGGAGPYTYVWSPSGGTAVTAANLLAGSYTITVTDANGCTSSSTAAVSNAGGPAINASVGTNVNCNGAATGSASVNVTAGTGPFTYSWSPNGGTGTNANNLAAGTYTVSVTDVNGCASTQTLTITEPTAISLVTNSTGTSCGASNGSASVNVSGGTGSYTYGWSPSGGNGSTANNLAGGSYTVTVTDGNGCISNASVTVANNGGATTSLQSSANVSCNGGANGSAAVSVAGGATPYTYAWSPAGGSNASASGLAAGNYTVTVTDANGCISAANVTITEPPAITAVATSTAATCGAANGTASVNASGGTGALTYIWTPSGGTGPAANNLTVGSYTVTVTDANGCSAAATAAVSNIGGPAITASVGTNVSCNGGNNGSASVNVNGGTGPFTYSWSPAGGTGTSAANLPAGTYTVNVSDANGCASTQSVSITEPPAINLSASSVATSCGSANGSASVIASGGTGAFTYAWSPSGGTATNASNLIAGNYTVTVTDANGCAGNASVVVANNGGATTTLQSSANVSCNGGANGSAAVTVAGGATPYTYSWSPAGGSAASATGLAAGNYAVTVTDANGCISSAAVTITEPPALTAITSTVPASCGASNGSATVNANGGTGALTYAWSPAGGTGITASNLAAGSYTVTIHDANGCTATAGAAVSNIGGPTVTASVGTNVSCNGGNNGTASVNVTSGTGPFTYAWSPSGGTASTASNLAAGNYSVTVTDANGCISTSGITVTQPPAMVVSTSSTPSSCGNANGSASVNASGGTGAFTYAWSPNGGTGITAGNLLTGAYTVTITDANGCTANATVNVSNVAGAVSSIQSSANVSCNGGTNGSATVLATGGTSPYTYSWTPAGGTGASAGNLAAGTYSVTVTDGGGCTSTASVSITQPAAIMAATSSTPASCGSTNGSATVIANGGTGSLTYLWTNGGGTSATAANLAAGNYSVTVTDANGCTLSAAAAVSNIGGPTATANAVNNVSCNGGNNGTASVNVSSGTAPFTYAWTPTGGTGTTASNLAAGNYTITVTDANGCITSQPVTITQPAAINLTTATTPSNCGAANGSASVNATGGSGTFTYSWTPGGATTAAISNVAAGGFSVTVTDGNGCISNVSVTVVNNGGATAAIQSSQNVSCNGGANGAATVHATGGATPYVYSWSPAGGTGASASNLATGNYTVTVTDANGCISTATVFINQPAAISASASTIPATCGTANGSATVTANGGTGTLSYLWTNGGGTSATASNLSAGNYSVTVTDMNGCTVTLPAAVSNVGGPSATASVLTNVMCHGGSNGSASVNVSAGTGPYTYLWSPSGGTGTTASGLYAGNYSVLVTDANGCISNQSVTISEPGAMSATTSAVSATCGSSNGSASVFAAGGTGAYTYLWSSGGSTVTAGNLAAGGYSVTVTDANGCTISATVNVNNTGGGTASLQSLTNVQCNGSSDGTATVTMAGGTGPFTYAWSPAGGTSATGTGLSAGAYFVTVTDANGCITTLPVSINEPAPMAVAMASTQAACTGVPNGTANAVVTGGTGPYTYSWSPGGGTTSTINGLYAGNYSVVVTDASGCTTSNAVQVTSPSNVSLSINATPEQCYGGDEGTATVIVSGGTAPFTYAWNPGGQTTSAIAGITAGGYSVTVTDASGCISVIAVTVTEPGPVIVNVTGPPALCIGQQGIISAAATGGTAPYSYSWSNGSTSSSQSVNPSSSAIYTINVTDANGCAYGSVDVPVTVFPPLSVSATATNEICAGDPAYLSSAATGGNGGPYTYSWNNGVATTANATVNPTVYTSYTVVINDGCSPAVQTTVNVNVNPLPVVSFMPHEITGCTPVSVDFLDMSTVPAGSSYSWNLGDGAVSSESNPTHVYTTPGDYSVSLVVVSPAGCQNALTITELVHVEALPVASFLMSTNETTVLNSTVAFTDKSSNTWTWSWDFGDSSGTSHEVNPSYTYADPGTYTITLITENQIGCLDTAYSTLRVKNDFAIYVPNTFTPNGDGMNDGFIPFGVGWSTFSMVILDRWGIEIYHTNDPKRPWDGTYEHDGRRCQSDVYIYKVLVTEESSKLHELLGHVTLVQ